MSYFRSYFEKNNTISKDDKTAVDNETADADVKPSDFSSVNEQASSSTQSFYQKVNNIFLGVLFKSYHNIQSVNWKLIIFIAFLLGVLVWIIFINRALLKEKRDVQNDDQASFPEEKNKDNNLDIKK